MFFDYYAFLEDSYRDIMDQGQVKGFEFKTKITYYRGIPLSMIAGIDILVDHEPVDQSKIHFSPDGEKWFTIEQMRTETNEKWEFGSPATVFVEFPGGLPKGEHAITVRTTITVAYSPMNFMGERTRTISIS